MSPSEFNTLLPNVAPVLALDATRQMYSDEAFWSSIGTHQLDVQITQLGDFYAKCNANQRRTLRRSLNPGASWPLLAYIRRMALHILTTKDSRWLTAALQVASLENASCDYRDSIVSLVIARAAAEAVSIDPVPHFAKAISKCAPEMVSTFKNARDHRPNDVRHILREFGPAELKPKRQRRTS